MLRVSLRRGTEGATRSLSRAWMRCQTGRIRNEGAAIPAPHARAQGRQDGSRKAEGRKKEGGRKRVIGKRREEGAGRGWEAEWNGWEWEEREMERGKRKTPAWGCQAGVEGIPGSDLLSHTESRAVPLALEGLTTEFGMGSGVTPPVRPPGNFWRQSLSANVHCKSSWFVQLAFKSRSTAADLGLRQKRKMVKPHGRLVLVSSTSCDASTSSLLPCGLQGAFRSRSSGRPNLEGGFPLRCFQRLSIPDIATRQCHWRDNRHTRGQFIPVLSY